MEITFPIIDLETRSRVNLRAHGLARYARDDSTSILVMSYIMPGELRLDRVKRWLPPYEPFPEELVHWMAHGSKVGSWNAAFEAELLRYKVPLLCHDTINWYDFAGHARYVGIPGSLEDAGTWLGLPPEHRKDKAGHAVMLQVSVPMTKGKQKGEFNNDPALLERTYAYCDQDCIAEGAAFLKLPPWPESEQAIWRMTFAQNLRGCPIDLDLCRSVVAVSDQLIDGARDTIHEHTKGEICNPTQNVKIVKWLNERGINISDLQAPTVAKVLEYKDLDDSVKAVLLARQIGAPASIKKFKAALNKEVNGRLYHNFMYCGGGATGRWSGASDDSDSVQLQNLFRASQTEEMLDVIKMNSAAILNAVSDSPVNELQKSTRAMLCAGTGHDFLYTDLAGIEARTLRWLARSPSLEDFRKYDQGGPDPYRVEAAKTFGKKIEDITGDERQCGKVLVLQGQYQSGWQKVQNTVLVKGGVTISDTFAELTVKKFRAANPEIVKFWKDLERAFEAVLTGAKDKVKVGYLEFAMPYKGIVTIKLPSGRLIHYNRCRILTKDLKVGEKVLRKGSIAYVKHDGKTIGFYGGHCSENTASGVARDVMAEAMLKCEEEGFGACQHAHDGLLSEYPSPVPDAILKRLSVIMTTPPAWAPGLPLASPVKVVRRMP